MKEISEINKKINLAQGVAAGAPVAPAAGGLKAPPRSSLPPGVQQIGGGLGFTNPLAPHLQPPKQ